MEVHITEDTGQKKVNSYKYLQNAREKYISLSGINRIAQQSHAYSGPFLQLPALTEH